MPHTPREVVRSQALEVARGWSPPGAPASWKLTASLFALLAHDEELLDLASEIPAERLPALIFSAAARHLIAERGPADLVRYFPVPGGSQPLLDAEFCPAFRNFCLSHRDELLDLCRRRRYQMNEVARSTQVALALAVLGGRRAGVPIALIDIGTGAGLGLHLDRYRYHLSDGRRFGDPVSHLELLCDVNGHLRPPVPDALPPIAQRIGVDIEPIDLADPDARRWATSCIPPEAATVTRFERAVEIAQGNQYPILRGDAVETVPQVIDQIEDDHLPVLVDTYTAVFFSDEQRLVFRDALTERGRVRDLAWISLDPLTPLGTRGRDSVQRLHVPDQLVSEYQEKGVFALLGLLSFERGSTHARLLGRAHPSGTRLSWLDATTAA